MRRAATATISGVKLEESNDDPRTKVKSLFARNNRGELVPLSDLVTMVEEESMVAIWRSNRERSITVYANVKAGESQQKALEAAASHRQKDSAAGLPRRHDGEFADASPNLSRASSGSCCSGSSWLTWCWRRSSTASSIRSRC